uniref:Uncharacterized protein n=1 Tax=Rhizophora mucronata TaxID=61149 RepID=A0A2P2PPH2_RHIMU
MEITLGTLQVQGSTCVGNGMFRPRRNITENVRKKETNRAITGDSALIPFLLLLEFYHMSQCLQYCHLQGIYLLISVFIIIIF